MRKLFFQAMLLFLIGGCAGKVVYMPPTQTYKANNSVTINKPKADVWKQIIPALGSSFFVINNLDKESGFINVSYTGNPEKYVDCGIIDSYVMNARGERRYVFPASAAYKEYEAMQNGQNLLFLKRRMNLDGRINIILQEVSSTQTLVTANTKYVLTKDLYISNPQGQSQHLTNSISFNTNGSAAFPQQTTCYSTGTLEQEVLSALGL